MTRLQLLIEARQCSKRTCDIGNTIVVTTGKLYQPCSSKPTVYTLCSSCLEKLKTWTASTVSFVLWLLLGLSKGNISMRLKGESEFRILIPPAFCEQVHLGWLCPSTEGSRSYQAAHSTSYFSVCSNTFSFPFPFQT